MMQKRPKHFLIVTILSVFIYWGNEIILGFVDFQNSHYAHFFGGSYVTVECPLVGRLRGFTSVSREGREFYEWLGVPFALPPVQELRFEDPVAFPPWQGTRDAFGYGYKCLQYDFLLSMLIGDEDCLTLNVHSPSKWVVDPTSGQKLLPVLVFIFGGMFMFGRTDVYRPEYFMDQDIVLVTINYRVAAFGFLSSGNDGIVRGNMGLKDQVMALKWIQANIAEFGGDPNLVTIWGESAGGASVQLHMISEMSKGLFHRGISMSGTALNNWALNLRPREQIRRLGQTLGCPTSGDTGQLVKCLKSIDANIIARTFMESRDTLHDRLAAYAPTIESVIDDGTFLVENPKNALQRKNIVTKVPWLVGVNDMEGLIYAGDILLNKTCSRLLAQNWLKHAPTLWNYEELPEKLRDEMSQKIWDFYLKDHKVLRLPQSIQNLSAIFSDINFYRPLRQVVELQSSLTPMYLYYYSYSAGHGLGQVFMTMPGIFPLIVDGLFSQIYRLLAYTFLQFEEKRWGACHTDELGILFKLPVLINRIERGSVDFEFSRAFVQKIVYFATHGKPMDENGASWPPVKPGDQSIRYMKLDTETQMVDEPFTKRVEFVMNLFKNAGLS